jgi:hypothetical protein
MLTTALALVFGETLRGLRDSPKVRPLPNDTLGYVILTS